MARLAAARYPGTCPECLEVWRPGDRIRSRDDEPAESLERWAHAVCPDPAPTVRPGEVACPACWLIHPEGVCDRC